MCRLETELLGLSQRSRERGKSAERVPSRDNRSLQIETARVVHEEGLAGVKVTCGKTNLSDGNVRNEIVTGSGGR